MDSGSIRDDAYSLPSVRVENLDTTGLGTFTRKD